jgi:hypothetical protein
LRKVQKILYSSDFKKKNMINDESRFDERYYGVMTDSKSWYVVKRIIGGTPSRIMWRLLVGNGGGSIKKGVYEIRLLQKDPKSTTINAAVIDNINRFKGWQIVFTLKMDAKLIDRETHTNNIAQIIEFR